MSKQEDISAAKAAYAEEMAEIDARFYSAAARYDLACKAAYADYQLQLSKIKEEKK